MSTPSDSGLARLVTRAGIRAGAVDEARLLRDSWDGWVKAQLALPAEDEGHVRDALNTAKLKISYEAGDGYKGLTEDRPLSSLRKPTRAMWHLTDWEAKLAWEERIRPGEELLAATHIRASLTDAQLRETVADFWRDHFAVNRDASEHVQIALPTYEQEVLRKHAFGNFREMLEAVASSTAMLAYLNNVNSRASPANENYARELFELHSLGSKAYLHRLYDKWRDVPGALQGKAEGYIDEDVYEAARAFTGWSYETGQYVAEGVTLPNTGEFSYIELWHDPYQKRVLGDEYPSHLAALADGRRVLDQVAFHKATALHVSHRLCRRFVADAPPDDLVRSTAQVFMEKAKAPDQIAQVLKHILMSPEFAASPERLQRPLFLLASIQRKAGVVLPPSPDMTWTVSAMGHKLYNWPSPAGHPLATSYWSSPGLLVRRWRGLRDIWLQVMALQKDRRWSDTQSFLADWSGKLGTSPRQSESATAILAQEFGDPGKSIGFDDDNKWSVVQALTFLSATPEFQAV